MKRSGFIALGALLLAGSASASESLCGACKVELFAKCGGFLEGITVDPQGGLWAVDLLSGNVLSIGEDGKCAVRGNTGGQPNGAKFGPDGQLWIADKQRGLLRMNPHSGEIAEVAAYLGNERLRGTNDLVFDAKGGVYFTEPYGSDALDPDGRLLYLPPGPNAAVRVVGEGLAFPNGVVIAPDGRTVYVGEFARKRIVSLPAVDNTDPFGMAWVVAYTTGGIGPDGMTLTQDGVLLAANFSAGEVLVFDRTGRPMGSIVLPGGPMVTNVAIRGEWLYATEASRGEIWRVRLTR